jgi:transposase
LRVLTPCSAETRALRAVVRTRDDLVAQRVTASNQLAGVLDAFWPGPRRSSPTSKARSLAFLTRYPTPWSASAASALSALRDTP